MISSKSNSMEKPTECPKCESKNLKRIVYGLPGPDFSYEGVILGGCCIDEDSPDWHCEDCRWEWGHGAGRYADPDCD